MHISIFELRLRSDLEMVSRQRFLGQNHTYPDTLIITCRPYDWPFLSALQDDDALVSWEPQRWNDGSSKNLSRLTSRWCLHLSFEYRAPWIARSAHSKRASKQHMYRSCGSWGRSRGYVGATFSKTCSKKYSSRIRLNINRTRGNLWTNVNKPG